MLNDPLQLTAFIIDDITRVKSTFLAIWQLLKQTSNDIEFIRWFHEFSVTKNLRIFQETEFIYLFLCTVNVNNNIQFR